MTFQKAERSSGAIAALFGKRSYDPAARLSPGLQDEAQSPADDDPLSGYGLAPRGGQDLPGLIAEISQEQSFPRSTGRLATADQPRRNDPRVVPGQNVPTIEKGWQLGEPVVCDPAAGAIKDHQSRLLARLRRLLRDQFVGKIEVKLGGEHASHSFRQEDRNRGATGPQADSKIKRARRHRRKPSNYCTVLSMLTGLPRNSEPLRKPSSPCRP